MTIESNRNRLPKARLGKLVIDELSIVDRPCQEPATVALMKRAPKIAKGDQVTCAKCSGYVAKDAAKCPTCGGMMTKSALFSRLLKQAVLTSAVDGHEHAIDLDDPSESWLDMYSTSFQTSDGATQPHSHSWTFDATSGVITIGSDSGHTHTVSVTVPPDVLTAYVALDAAKDAANAAVPAEIAAETSDGVPAPVTDESSSGANVNVTIVQARAPQVHTHEESRSISFPGTTSKALADKIAAREVAARGGSPTTNATAAASSVAKSPRTTTSQQGSFMTDADRIKQLETENTSIAKRAERLDRIAKMSGAHKTHFDTLSGDDAESFLAKSTAERDAVVKAAADADPIEHTAEDGTVYRKSAGAQVIALAKRVDEANKIAKAERDARQVEIYKSRAKTEIGHLGGTDEQRANLLKRIDTETDVKERDALLAIVKGADFAMASQGKPIGSDGATGPTGASALLKTAVEEYAKANNIEHYAVAFAKATASDPKVRELYAAAQAERN